MASKKDNSKLQRTGHFKEDNKEADKGGENLDSMLRAKQNETNRIFNKDGSIDARAFKRLIFER